MLYKDGEKYFTQSPEVVNNLTTGGTTKALSAEQGKVLKQTIDALPQGGHTIITDGGTSLTQRDNLQAKGIYTHDDSTNGKTVMEVVREFNSVDDIEALTGEEAKGFQHIPDTVYRGRTASDIGFDKTGTSFNSTRVQDVLEEVDTRLKPRVVKTIPANTFSTYALALAELETYYDSLTSLEKETAYIMRGNVKANINVPYDKTFSYVNINAGSLINIQLYDLTNHEFNYAQTTTSGTTFGSLSSSTQSNDLTLYTIA